MTDIEPISDDAFESVLVAAEDMASHDTRTFMGYSLKSIVAYVRAQDAEIERLREAEGDRDGL